MSHVIPTFVSVWVALVGTVLWISSGPATALLAVSRSAPTFVGTAARRGPSLTRPRRLVGPMAPCALDAEAGNVFTDGSGPREAPGRPSR